MDKIAGQFMVCAGPLLLAWILHAVGVPRWKAVLFGFGVIWGGLILLALFGPIIFGA